MAHPKTLPIKRFASAAAWDAWLRTHHTRSPGVWLEIARQGRRRPPLSHAQALETALRYGWIDGQKASGEAGWWRQRFTPRTRRSKWSQINCAAVERLHAQGRLRPAGLEQMAAAKRDGRWKAAYASQRTITIPRDLRAALADRPRARVFFEALDSRNRYAILYRLQDAKKAETRQRRLQKFVRMLEARKTLHPRPARRRRTPPGAGGARVRS
ncbi:MAG TPA: YdeI/OmpD-associated family protein [Gemmatimonadales bacterium]